MHPPSSRSCLSRLRNWRGLRPSRRNAAPSPRHSLTGRPQPVLPSSEWQIASLDVRRSSDDPRVLVDQPGRSDTDGARRQRGALPRQEDQLPQGCDDAPKDALGTLGGVRLGRGLGQDHSTFADHPPFKKVAPMSRARTTGIRSGLVRRPLVIASILAREAVCSLEDPSD